MNIFFHTNSHKIFFYLFIFTFILQIFFWTKSKEIKPQYDLLPNLPTTYLTEAMSFGDKEFLFRILANRLQNSGDVFAGFVALKNYDYKKLYQWFTLLDNLNKKSHFTPALAAYYYGNTQNKKDTIYVVKYLEEHSMKDLNHNWWWLYQAIYLATNALHDKNLALDLSYKLSRNTAQTAPLWTKQMPAFIHAKYGESCMAFKIIQNMINEHTLNKRQFSASEMDFMRFFINDRLSKLKNKNFNLKNCQ